VTQKFVALIVGAGPQLGASCAKRFSQAGLTPVLSSRNGERLRTLAGAIPGAIAWPCDATDEAAVEAMVAGIEAAHGPIDCCVYNPGGGFNRVPVIEQTAERFEAGWRTTALGGFLVGRAVAKRMVPRGRGTIIVTGATASMRGGPGFAAFAAGKFALRALAQSMARELQPRGIHVVHAVIDGKIRDAGIGANDGTVMDPNEIASTYAGLYFQGKSNWTQELDLRPFAEKW
jgi:NAD(P)-dependent dehydrogenase (short-subunit alcohol dehydrogenase family)